MLPIAVDSPHASRVASLYPATKMLWLGAACAAALATHQPAVLLATLGLLWITWLAAGLAWGVLWRVSWLCLPFCVALLGLQVLFRHDGAPCFRMMGLTVYTGALEVGLSGALRILCLATAGAQFWSWTHPTDLAVMLADWGVPYRYAFLPTVAFRAFPWLAHELQGVLEGQQLRGVELTHAWDQVRHFPQLFIPFCITTLAAGNDMALALELRGFGAGGQRTHLRALTACWWDYAASAACVAFIALSVSGVLR